MSFSYRQLRGQNIREHLMVDCTNTWDITRTKIVFECMAPQSMRVEEVIKSRGNNAHPCSWEVVYTFKPESGKQCTEENAKSDFEEILRGIPFNTTAIEKRIVGHVILKYKVLFEVNSCCCAKPDFEFGNFIVKLENTHM